MLLFDGHALHTVNLTTGAELDQVRHPWTSGTVYVWIAGSSRSRLRVALPARPILRIGCSSSTVSQVDFTGESVPSFEFEPPFRCTLSANGIRSLPGRAGRILGVRHDHVLGHRVERRNHQHELGGGCVAFV